MTTAARPTFEPAKGGMGKGERDLSALSKQYSSRDLPGHTRLKYREHGQSTSEELRSRDFRRELDEREKRRSGSNNLSHARESHSSSSHAKKLRLESVAPSNLDADDPIDDDEGDADEDEDSDDSDDESALYAELERIRKERMEDEMRRERERAEQEERIRMENIISGNPLLNIGASAKADMKVHRRWDDDVVFKNCAAAEPKPQKTFINDALRSDFHKRFMEKYVK